MSTRCPRHSATKTQTNCPDCRAAKRADYHRRQQRKRDGTYIPLADATPARDHIAKLHTTAPLIAIAKASGLPPTTVYGIAAGRVTTTHQDTLNAILNIQQTHPALHTPRVPIGLVRRAQALCAIGHGLGTQSLACNLSPHSGMHRILAHQGAPRKTTQTAIHEMYNRLRHEPPEPTGAGWVRNMARRCRWPTPDAWTDETIENPYAAPIDPQDQIDITDVNIAANRILLEQPVDTSSLTRAERFTLVTKLTQEGIPLTPACHKAKTSPTAYRLHLETEPEPTPDPAGPLVLAIAGDQTTSALKCGYQLYTTMTRLARGPGQRTVLCADQPGAARIAADIARATLCWDCRILPQHTLIETAAEVRENTGAHAVFIAVVPPGAGDIAQRNHYTTARALRVPTEKITPAR